MSRRAVGTLALAVSVVSLLTSVLTGVVAPVPASADTPTDIARHRAFALANQVAELETKVEIAGEAFAASQAALGSIVREQVAAAAQLDALRTSNAADDQALSQQVRTLYISAGSVSLIPNILRGQSPQDVMSQLDTMSRVLEHSQAVIGSVQSRVNEVDATNKRLTALADQRTSLSGQADAAQNVVISLLADRQAALASASADVLRFEQQDIINRQTAAAARAAAALAKQNAAVSPNLPNPLPPASPLAAVAIAAARAEIGKPYQYAGNGPDVFDCSGLTVWAYASVGIALPRTAAEQWNIGPHIQLADLRPGDLLFWATDTSNPATIHHVAIYVGAGWMIQAPHTGAFVEFSKLYLDGYIGASRPPGV